MKHGNNEILFIHKKYNLFTQQNEEIPQVCWVKEDRQKSFEKAHKIFTSGW
jgi:hypothetical protein